MARINVFVSHVSVEARFADFLRHCLRRDFIGLLDLFISTDSTSIPVQLTLLSPEAVKAPWINFESGAARMKGVELIPLCHSGQQPEQLPPPLNMSEGVVLTSATDLEKLYRRIADVLESDMPDVDFADYARQFVDLEAEYARQREHEAAAGRRSTDERVQNPRVVCVTSRQFMDLGYRNQVEVVLKAFPQDVQHDIIIGRDKLESILMTESVDILHIATYVCPRSGDLYFSSVDLRTGAANEEPLDMLRPEAFAELLESARTRLVVIASGNSLALATALLSVTNVIAPSGMVSATALALWVRSFYETLRVKPLSEACEYAAKASQVPMQLLAQQTAVPHLDFSGRVEQLQNTGSVSPKSL
jgi:hypothetical protein